MFFIPLFLSNLKTKKIGKQIEYIRTTGSTNKTIYHMLQNKEIEIEGVLISDQQTEGKGRRGNTWFSSAGKSLTFSLILKSSDKSLTEKLPLISGIAIIQAIKKMINIDCQLKWPNDIVYNYKKLGGILIEKRGDNFIIGIGLNVNDSDFDESIQNQACSIYSIIDRSVQREPLLAFILNDFEKLLNNDMEEIIKKWESVCSHMNTFVKFHYSKNILEGDFLGLSKNGEAKIKINKKEHLFNSGVINI